MLSSERVLSGAGAASRERFTAQATPAESRAPAKGVVLRGLRPGASGAARRAASAHGHGPGAVRGRTERAAEPAPPADDDLRRLHDIAEKRGFKAGMARAERELASAVAAAGAVAAQLEADAPTQRAALARWVTDLSLAITRRILGDAIQADPALMVAAIERAITVANGSPDVQIQLHPQAVERVRDAWDARHGAGYLGKRWSFGADPTLPPTGCVVRYQHGLVDAGIEAHLDAITSAVGAAIHGSDRTVELDPVS